MYDPASGAWRAVAAMGVPRAGHRLVTLPDGTALVTGGRSSNSEASYLATAERYAPGGSAMPGLPNTGAGAPERVSALAVALVGGALALLAVAARRARRRPRWGL